MAPHATAAGLALPDLIHLPFLSDCANYALTVEPFLHQLNRLPFSIQAAITDPSALFEIYLATNPVISGLALSILIMPIAFVLSEFNKNYSQIDRVWSILPTVYNLHFAVWARLNNLPTQRLDNIAACGVIWSIRLTYNYWRKGGYQIGSEDYRWELIQKRIGRFGFFLLNVLFISSVQSILLFAVATPTYIILLASRVQPTMTWADIFFSRAIMALVVFEYFADGQMWDYQESKKKYQKTAIPPNGWRREQLDRGFITTGLWKYSRHPNFAAEQTIWVLLYAWGCVAANNVWWNWTVGGAIAYLAVFQGSTPLTERISAGKYSEYKLYQERVGMFLPWKVLLGRVWNEEEASKAATGKAK